MSNRTQLDEELERRLDTIEAAEIEDPMHARLSGRTIASFLAVVFGIVAAAWIGSVL